MKYNLKTFPKTYEEYSKYTPWDWLKALEDELLECKSVIYVKRINTTSEIDAAYFKGCIDTIKEILGE